MKEAIYTIPVLDAFRAETECPLCHMFKMTEENAVTHMLGDSYMDDKTRMATNEVGFCGKHYALMFKEQNRLGLGLMLETHMQTVNSALEKLALAQSGIKSGGFMNLKAKKSKPLNEYIKKITSSCYICNKIEAEFERYIDTFFLLWKQKHSGLHQLVKSSKGFCLNHFELLLETAEHKLNSKELNEFSSLITSLEIEHLKSLENDVSRFVKKFDYRYANEPWENAKDSIPRAVLKMSSEQIYEP